MQIRVAGGRLDPINDQWLGGTRSFQVVGQVRVVGVPDLWDGISRVGQASLVFYSTFCSLCILAPGSDGHQ